MTLTVDQFFDLAGRNVDAIAAWMVRNDVPPQTFGIEIVSQNPPLVIAHYYRAQGNEPLFDADCKLKTNEMPVFDLPPIK